MGSLVYFLLHWIQKHLYQITTPLKQHGTMPMHENLSPPSRGPHRCVNISTRNKCTCRDPLSSIPRNVYLPDHVTRTILSVPPPNKADYSCAQNNLPVEHCFPEEPAGITDVHATFLAAALATPCTDMDSPPPP
jgi:hypothetical protein